jgi:hypothetical protein
MKTKQGPSKTLNFGVLIDVASVHVALGSVELADPKPPHTLLMKIICSK